MTMAMSVIESEAKNGRNKHTGPPVAVRSVNISDIRTTVYRLTDKVFL